MLGVLIREAQELEVRRFLQEARDNIQKREVGRLPPLSQKEKELIAEREIVLAITEYRKRTGKSLFFAKAKVDEEKEAARRKTSKED